MKRLFLLFLLFALLGTVLLANNPANPPRNVHVTTTQSQAHITWDAPEEPEPDGIWFSHAVSDEFGGYLEVFHSWMHIDVEIAQRFTQEQLIQFGVSGAKLTEISFLLGHHDWIWDVMIPATINIYTLNTDPGYPIVMPILKYSQQTIFFPGTWWGGPGHWAGKLDTPFQIPTTGELWIAIVVNPGVGIPYDIGPSVNGHGDIGRYENSFEGYWGEWQDEFMGTQGNWLIKGKAIFEEEEILFSSFSGYYEVFRTLEENINNQFLWTHVGITQETEYFDEAWATLEPGTYRYIVMGLYEDLILSAPGISNAVIKLPDSEYPRPINFELYVDGITVTLVWEAPNDDVISYEVYRNGELLNQLEDNVFIDGTAQYNIRYTYGVIAVYQNGSSDADEITITILYFAPPLNLNANDENNKVYLSWETPETHNLIDLQSFMIYRNDEILIDSTQSTQTNFIDENVELNLEYTYFVKAIWKGDIVTVSDPSNIVAIKLQTLSDIDEPVLLTTSLQGNYPNPFNPETVIHFTLAETGFVSLKVYNIKGQIVSTLLNQQIDKGLHYVVWNGNDDAGRSVSSGLYFYVLSVGEITLTRRMVLMK